MTKFGVEYPTHESEIIGASPDPETTITVRDPDGGPVPGRVDIPVDSIGQFSCIPVKQPQPGVSSTGRHQDRHHWRVHDAVLVAHGTVHGSRRRVGRDQTTQGWTEM